MTAAGETQVVPVVIELDPRLAAEGVTAADLEAQAEFLGKVAAVRERARDLESKLRDHRDDLRDAIEQGDDDAAARDRELQALQARLSTRSGGAYQQPMLISQLSYLASNSGRADQRPGNHAYLRLEELDKELVSCEAAYQRLTDGR